jgi:hypothetical protein
MPLSVIAGLTRNPLIGVNRKKHDTFQTSTPKWVEYQPLTPHCAPLVRGYSNLYPSGCWSVRSSEDCGSSPQ